MLPLAVIDNIRFEPSSLPKVGHLTLHRPKLTLNCFFLSFFLFFLSCAKCVTRNQHGKRQHNMGRSQYMDVVERHSFYLTDADGCHTDALSSQHQHVCVHSVFTSCNRCTQTNIKYVLPAPFLEASTSSDVSLKTSLALTHRSIFRANHVHMLGGSTVFPTSSLRPAKAREQQHVGDRLGNHNIAPLCRMHLNTLNVQERCARPSAIDSRRSSASFMLFSISPSVSLYAKHIRTFPPNSIHRHVLQPFALPRRVTALPPQEPYTLVGITIELTGLCSLWVPHSTVLTGTAVLNNLD